MRTFFKRSRLFSSKGFTLAELLMVGAVIAIVTTVLLFSQGRFSSSTLLRSLGYSVALTVRQAQVFGVTVRNFGQGSASFAPGYGTFISTGDLTRVYLFADTNGNGIMDTSPQDERLSGAGASALVLGRGYTVSAFCAVTAAGARDCYPAGQNGGLAVSSLTIYFKRPNPDGCFETSAQPSACAPGGTQVYTGAYIQVSQQGSTDVRSVRVSATGQIVVCPLGADPATC